MTALDWSLAECEASDLDCPIPPVYAYSARCCDSHPWVPVFACVGHARRVRSDLTFSGWEVRGYDVRGQ